MSAEHRKPVVAFIVLAVLAAAVVGFQRADARSGQFFASLLGATGQVEGTLPPEVTWSADGAVIAHPSFARIGYSTEAAADALPRAHGPATWSATRHVPPGKAAARRQSTKAPADARDGGRRVATGLRRPASGKAGRHAVGRSGSAAHRSPGRAHHAAHRVARGGPGPESLRKTSRVGRRGTAD